MGKIEIGVDRAGVETTVVFINKEKDGAFVVIAELRGAAAEYVAGLESDNKLLKTDNRRLRQIEEATRDFIYDPKLPWLLLERLEE